MKARNRKKQLISVVTPCFNEEENIREVHRQVQDLFAGLEYDYEHIFIDNASTDKTAAILRKIAQRDKKIKVILNSRNFGHIRSPYYGLLQAQGDAAVLLVADLQDPVILLQDFLTEWKKGFKIVVGVKNQSEESAMFFFIRKMYYTLSNRLSEIRLIKNFTGFGLYDRQIINILKEIDDPYPYFRGLICDIGFEIRQIPYVQPIRKRGFSKNNFYTLYDMAMLGITNHSKIPLRLATFAGFFFAGISFLTGLGYFVAKILFWNSFELGLAPLVVGVFFFNSVFLIFVGIIGEYVGAIHTQVIKRPLVVEKERINFR